MKNKRTNLTPWFLLGSGLIIFVAGLVWVIMNRQSQSLLTPTPASVDQVPRVSLEDAKAAYDAGTAVFVDVRDRVSYQVSHIPGAIAIPLNELPNHVDALDPEDWIIPY